MSWKFCQSRLSSKKEKSAILQPSDNCVHLSSCVGITSLLRSSGGTRPRPDARSFAQTQTAPLSLWRRDRSLNTTNLVSFLPRLRDAGSRCASELPAALRSMRQRIFKNLRLGDELRETLRWCWLSARVPRRLLPI